jgi:hypothetical protein
VSDSGAQARERSHFLANLRRAIRHPWLVMFVGVVMFGSGLAELLQDVDPEFESVIRMHHGMMLFGLVSALRGLVEALEGLQTVGEVYEDE